MMKNGNEHQSLNPDLSNFQPDDKLLDKVSTGLANLPEDDTVEDENLQEEDASKKTAGAASEDAGDKNQSEGASSEAGSEDEVVIPEAYLRTAVHQGLDREDVVDFVKANPEKGLKFLESVYKSTNYITSQLSNIGRLARKQSEAALETDRGIQTGKSEPKVTSVDVSALEEKYGDENPALIEVVKVLGSAIGQISGEINSIKSAQITGKATESNDDFTLWNMVNGFFNGEDLKEYTDFYGTADPNAKWDYSLTGQQYQNRMAVVEMADQIVTGAELQGRKMSYAEALERAHYSVSEPMIASVAHKNVLKSVKQRSKGITVKSQSAAKSKPASTKVKSGKPEENAALVGKVKTGLSKLFGTEPTS